MEYMECTRVIGQLLVASIPMSTNSTGVEKTGTYWTSKYLMNIQHCMYMFIHVCTPFASVHTVSTVCTGVHTLLAAVHVYYLY